MANSKAHKAHRKKIEIFKKRHPEGRTEYSKTRRKAILQKNKETWHTPNPIKWKIRQLSKPKKKKVLA